MHPFRQVVEAHEATLVAYAAFTPLRREADGA